MRLFGIHLWIWRLYAKWLIRKCGWAVLRVLAEGWIIWHLTLALPPLMAAFLLYILLDYEWQNAQSAWSSWIGLFNGRKRVKRLNSLK